MKTIGGNAVITTSVYWTILYIVQNTANAGPVKRPSRITREVYPEIEPEKEGNLADVCIVGDVVYNVDEVVPAEQPCLKCRCQPPGVQCETTRCIKRPGCRAIHKPNQCCPEYQCECEYEGRTYDNGERLQTSPGGECKVCYCRGGEVQCTEVSCYIRTDCEGRSVPGQCCPRYDHCPPKEPNIKNSQEIADYSLSSSTNWISTIAVQNSTTAPIYDLQENYVEGVKENEDHIAERIDVAQTETGKQEETDQAPKITIQEIIPEIRDHAGTSIPHIVVTDRPEMLEDTLNSTGFENDVAAIDSDTDSSEISETFHQPPPILRIGDKLLYLKKDELVSEKDSSTPSPVITLIGAEGLERGYEDSSEVGEPQKKNATSEVDGEAQQSTHILSLVKFNKRTTTEVPITSETPTDLKVVPLENSDIVKNERERADDAGGTETGTLAPESATASISTEDVTETVTESIEIKTESLENDTLVNNNQNLTTEVNILEVSSTTLSSSTAEVNKDEILLMEENPAYPPIPEIMVPEIKDDLTDYTEHDLHIKNTTEQSTTSLSTELSTATESLPVIAKILATVLEIRNNHTIPVNISHSEWLKEDTKRDKNNSTLVNTKAALPDDILLEPVASDFSNIEEADMTTNPTPATTDIKLDRSATTTEAVQSLQETTTITQENTEINKSFGSNVDKNAFTQSQVLLLADEPKPAVIDSIKPFDESNSRESVETAAEDSGEATTKSSNHASLMSNENASVFVENNASPEQSNSEFIETLPRIESQSISDENKSAEQTDVTENKPEETSEVEMIDPNVLTSKSESIQKSSTAENETKTVEKRENQLDQQIFQELDAELSAPSTQRTQTEQEEEKEAQQIFKELLDEVNSTPKAATSKTNMPKSGRETEVLQRVSDAIAKFHLRDSKQSLDTNILGILRDFFSSQYRSYDG